MFDVFAFAVATEVVGAWIAIITVLVLAAIAYARMRFDVTCAGFTLTVLGTLHTEVLLGTHAFSTMFITEALDT
jgi:hypothetical protein